MLHCCIAHSNNTSTALLLTTKMSVSASDFDESIEVLAVEEELVELDRPKSDSASSSNLSATTSLRQSALVFPKLSRSAARESSHKANVSARDRANETEFKGVTHEDGGLLFCSACNLVIEHTRKSSITSQFESAKHKKRSEAAYGPEEKKQKTLATAFKNSTTAPCARIQVI